MAKGLGRGLGALLSPTPPPAADAAPEKGPVTLPIRSIKPNPHQPRRSFDEASLQALADSIRAHGLIQPLAVRREPDGERYTIIAGERRWRASRLAGLKEVPAVVLEADELKMLELALVENLQREDLNPIEEAESFRLLIDRFGLTQEDAASRVGRSRPAVANALRLLSLSDELRRLVQEGKLSAGHARTLLGIADEAERARVAQLVVENDLSVRETEAIAADIRARAEAGPAPEKPEKAKKSLIREDYFAAWRSDLSSRFGRKVDFKPGRKKGVITLEYYDNDDLEALVSQLSSLSGKGTPDE